MRHVHLDTATVGVPPPAAAQAVREALEAWADGTYEARRCDPAIAEARAAFARLVGVTAADVAVGPQVSPFVGLIAASLPPGSRVLAAENDFTSLLFPLLAQEARGVRVDLVPLERMPEAVDADTDLVAVSAVQSSDGRLADLEAIAAAARHHGALSLVDATQACGWLPLQAGRFDALVAGGYKWLLQPRGTAYLVVAEHLRDRLVANHASWYGNDDPWASLYGAPLRGGAGMRRFDVSPAWLSWEGAPAAFASLEERGIDAVHAHDVALAARFREALGLPPQASPIVALEADAGAADRLRAAGVRCSARAGRLRLSFHLYNDEDDVDAALAALKRA